MEVAAGIVAALEVAAVFDIGEGRFVEIGGTAEQVPYVRRDRRLRSRCRLASRKCILGCEDGQIAIPSGWQLARNHRLELGGFRRVPLGPGIESLLPVGLVLCT